MLKLHKVCAPPPKHWKRSVHELLFRVWSRRECSSCRILSMVCFLSWSSCNLESLAVAPSVSSPACGPEAEWSSGLCWGGPTGWERRDQDTSPEREKLCAWRRLSGTVLVCWRKGCWGSLTLKLTVLATSLIKLRNFPNSAINRPHFTWQPLIRVQSFITPENPTWRQNSF